MEVGAVYAIPVEPFSPEFSQFFEAGAITIALEYRNITPATVRASYKAAYPGKNFEELYDTLSQSTLGHEGVAASGFSIHVLSTDDQHEYLRFDCFDQDAHYHYLPPSRTNEPVANRVVPLDVAANGDALSWALRALRYQLPAMLTMADGSALVRALNEKAVTASVDEIERALKDPDTLERLAGARLHGPGGLGPPPG
jgi:hypothetical protein